MIKRVVYIVLIVAVAIVLVNDIGRWGVAAFNLNETTLDAARTAARANGTRAENYDAAEEYAQSQGAHVYGYDETPEKAMVWTETEVEDTFFLGSLMVALIERDLTSPWLIRDYADVPR